MALKGRSKVKYDILYIFMCYFLYVGNKHHNSKNNSFYILRLFLSIFDQKIIKWTLQTLVNVSQILMDC